LAGVAYNVSNGVVNCT